MGPPIALARLNAQALGLENLSISAPEGMEDDLQFAPIGPNPPIRIGKDALHELLLKWLPRLARGGEAWMVVQKNLGSDSLQKWLVGQLPKDWSITRETSSKGFRILKVARPN